MWKTDGQFLYGGNPSRDSVNPNILIPIHKGGIIALGGFNWAVWREQSLKGKYSADFADHQYYERRKAGSPLRVFFRTLTSDGSLSSIAAAAATFDPTDRSGITWEPGENVSASILCNHSRSAMRLAIQRGNTLLGWSPLARGECKAPFNAGSVALEIDTKGRFVPYDIAEPKDNKLMTVVRREYCVPDAEHFNVATSEFPLASRGGCPRSTRPLRINIELNLSDMDERHTLSFGS